MAKLALFRRVFLVTRWVRDRLTPSGMTLLGLTAFAAAFGIDTRANPAHLLFTLGVSLLAVDAIAVTLARRRSVPLRAQRLLPRFLSADQAGRYRLQVWNTGKQALAPQILLEHLAQPWPEAGSLAHRAGYSTFLALLRRLRTLEVDRLSLPPLLPGQRVELDAVARPNARGLAQFDGLYRVIHGPLGLVENRVRVDAPIAALAVLPARLNVAVPPCVSERLLQPGGISLAQHVGDAEEFRSLRDYRPGDPLRAIHWRSFARTGKPLVREYQEEFFSRHALVLDTAGGQAFGATFETAVSLAAGLVSRPREADSLLDLMFVGDRVHRLTSGRGLGETDTLLRVLATVTPTPATGITPLLASMERHAGQVSSLIIIFLAWDEVRRNAVDRLLARGLRPLVLLVGDTTGGVGTNADDSRHAGILQRIPAAEAA